MVYQVVFLYIPYIYCHTDKKTHHQFERRTLDSCGKTVRNEEIRKKTGLRKLEPNGKERRRTNNGGVGGLQNTSSGCTVGTE